MQPARLYRIYTEAKNCDGIFELTKAYVPSATFLFGTGLFNNKWEPCLVIEVIGDTSSREVAVHTIAQWIKNINNQQEVLVTTQIIERVTL